MGHTTVTPTNRSSAAVVAELDDVTYSDVRVRETSLFDWDAVVEAELLHQDEMSAINEIASQTRVFNGRNRLRLHVRA